MKFEIFDEKIEKEETIYFKLLKEGGGGIKLQACGKHGEHLWAGDILEIQSNGKLRLCSSISTKIGLQLTSRGNIKLA